MKYKNRLKIYIISFILIGVYIVFFNKHRPSDSLYLTKEEYKILTDTAEKNSTEALHMLYQYYRYYIRDENKTISFLENYLYLKNSFIDFEYTIRLLSSKNDNNIKRAIKLLENIANSGHKESQLQLRNLYRDGIYHEKNSSMSNFWGNKWENE